MANVDILKWRIRGEIVKTKIYEVTQPGNMIEEKRQVNIPDRNGRKKQKTKHYFTRKADEKYELRKLRVHGPIRTQSWASLSAPASSKSLTAEALPYFAAIISGVVPLGDAASR